MCMWRITYLTGPIFVLTVQQFSKKSATEKLQAVCIQQAENFFVLTYAVFEINETKRTYCNPYVIHLFFN